MTESLFSPSWYRVAELKPRLRSHAKLHRHHYRGQLWYVIEDHSCGRHHRVSRSAYCIVGLMDGERTVQAIWDASGEHLGDEVPTQEQVIQLLGQLHGADVLQCDVPPDGEELFRRYQRQERLRWKQRLWSPLSLRFPLLDPDRLLARGLPMVRPLFGWLGALVWLTVVGTALVLAGAHWPELTENAADRALAPQNLIWLWLTYPLVKVLHELGHGFATKVWGGEVHEMGIMLLVLMPLPYVDASAASAYRDKHRRMLVGAAGILVELFLASLALFVWINVEPGAVRTVAYNVMLIGGVSTLFFNGNPLLRFDAYYVLADAIEIPNLGARSTRYVGYLFQRYLFGVSDAVSPATAPGESAWLFVYGTASFVYRMFIMFVIILYIAGKFFAVGVILAIWAVITQIAVPLGKLVLYLWAGPQLRDRRARALTTIGALLVTVAALVLFLPIPLWTRTEGVVWLPQQAEVRTGTDGFVRRILVPSASTVSPGDPLIEAEDPFLSAQVQVLESRLRELTARYESKWLTERVQAEILKEEMATVEADLARARERADELVIRSPTAGVLVVPEAQDLPGRFLKKGDLVAYVTDLSRPTVRVVVTQGDIDLVRQRTVGVEVRLAERLSEPLAAEVSREVPEATAKLPSAALGTVGGGSLAVDPDDEQGLKVLQKVFQVDLALPEDTRLETVGGRVYVRFDHGSEPLARQWYRAARRLFLSRFGV